MFFPRYALLLLTLLPVGVSARAQTPDNTDCGLLPTRTEISDCTAKHLQTKVIFLANVSAQNDANEILIGLRNAFDPAVKVYLVASQNAIVLASYPAEVARMEAFIHELDRPKKTYRLTYTIAAVEDGKNIGTQHFSMVATDGQRTSMKEGDKIPVATGSFSTDNNSAQTQFTYLDVGMNFGVVVSSLAGGVSLQSKVEQSSIGPTNTIAGVAEPVVRQSVLEDTSAVTLGKPLLLGSIDIPNSNRRLDIDVVVEQLK